MEKYGQLWPKIRAAMARLGKYCTGGYGQIGVKLVALSAKHYTILRLYHLRKVFAIWCLLVALSGKKTLNGKILPLSVFYHLVS